jgi:predicted HicB family RNase H-like nuclease
MPGRRSQPGYANRQTTLTFSSSKKLKEMIQAAAAADRRSVSNWIVCALNDVLAQAGGTETSGVNSPDPLNRKA